MTQRIVTAVVVGGLVLVTAALVALALRPATPPATAAPPVSVGVVAVAGDQTWRWSGPSECTPDTDIIPLERRTGDGEWFTTPIPLVTVESLDFNERDQGIAIGTTNQCTRGVALSADGGRTWRYRMENPVLLDAWWGSRRLWGLERTTTTPELHAYKLRRGARLLPVPQIQPAPVCDPTDGTPRHVAFWTDRTGLLLCEQAVTDQRLVARTTTAGLAFERLTDNRPATGLDGAGPILDLDVAGRVTAWVQFDSDLECAEGQLRISDGQGVSWVRLPCPSDTAPVDLMLDAAFLTEDDGVLLGVRDGEVTMFETTDGGTTWQSE